MEEEIIKQQMFNEKQNQMNEQVENLKKEEVIKKTLLKILDNKARQRLNNIKIVKPEIAMQLSVYLMQLFQSGQVNSKLNDEQLKNILKQLNKKKEIKIKRI